MTQKKRRIQSIFFAMGTVCSITVYSEKYKSAVRAAKNRVWELHRKMNAYDPSSEVSQINQNAGVRYTAVSDDTRILIEHSINYSVLSGGLFDISTTPLSQLWKDSIRARMVPLEYDRARTAKLVNYRDILVDDNAVMLKRKGQQIDLGAIAKGYAADEVKRVLTEYGVDNAVINLGGTVVVMGEMQRVGIQNPFEKTGTSFASMPIKNQVVVSSGLYEQGFTIDGRTYHHIVNPKTGYPSDSELVGVTLIGDSAELLDALSTTTFMMHVQRAAEMLEPFGVQAIWITKDGGVFVTDQLRNEFSFISKGA